ncbi:hypothetical protein CR513_04233, partial [Mucuna pruriens]
MEKLEGGLESMKLDLHIAQNLECINCEDLTKVRIALSFEGYVLVWWNEIVFHFRHMRRASIKFWRS